MGPTIVDAQVHAYERDHPGRPWARALPGPPHVTGDEMVAAMDAAGVDAALLVSPWTMYRYDSTYALQVCDQHSDRFACVAPVDTRGADVAEVVRRWSYVPTVVGIRLMLWGDIGDDPDDPYINTALATAGSVGLPVCILRPGRLGVVGALADQHPQTRIVVDHLGLIQPFHPPVPADPFAALPGLLALASRANVAVKVTGVCTLSREPFPHHDIWGPLERVFEAFGLDRCMWGSDWTRTTALVSYDDAVRVFRESDRLSEGDRSQLMSTTLEQIFGWRPAGPPAR